MDQWRSGLPELHRLTHDVGDEPEDAKVVVASFVRCEMQPFAVVEVRNGCGGGRARTLINNYF